MRSLLIYKKWGIPMNKIEVDTEKLESTLDELRKVSQQYLIFQERSTEIIETQMELIVKIVDQIENSTILFHNEINKLTNRIGDLEKVIFPENNKSMH